MRIHCAVAVTVAAVAAVAVPRAAVADPPTPVEFEFETTDTRLCEFPFRVHLSGRQRDHFVAPGSKPGKEIITGPTQITLQNLETGYTVRIEPVGQGNVTVSPSTLTLYGRQVLLAGGVPVAQLKGQVTARLDTFQVTRQTGTEEIIDPCRLLAPGTPAAVARVGPAPWDAPFDVLGGIALADLTPPWFGFLMHIHAHLDVIVNGSPVPIPAGIGITEPFTAPNGDVLSAIDIVAPVHTHRNDGVLHIENDGQPLIMTLGQFFDIWQVRLTGDCLGAYCAGDGRTLRVYVNGDLVSGDPRDVILRPAEQIAVVYGPPGVPAEVPASYEFPPGTPQFGFPGG
jgi:hypothetical protein